MKDYLLKTVIVPWDFSNYSREALDVALEMVDSPSKIEVVHVAAYPTAMDTGIGWGMNSEDAVAENLAQAFEEARSQAGFPDLKFTTSFGDAGSQIADIAEDRGAGLIIISSHGRTGISRLLLGSVAERVVRLAPCPVLVLRDKPEAE